MRNDRERRDRTVTGERSAKLSVTRPPHHVTATAVQPLGNKSPPLAGRSTMTVAADKIHTSFLAGEKSSARILPFRHCMLPVRLNERSPTRKGFRSTKFLLITHLITCYALQQYSKCHEPGEVSTIGFQITRYPGGSSPPLLLLPR